jgi:CheY-like chemotaxis protein
MSRIVVIEDNVNNARMVDKLLRHAGHDLILEEEGEAGLATVIATVPDLVLVDLGLPDVDGQTIVAMIRQYPTLSRTRIIAFTAWPEDRAQEMAKAYGCDGVITKPIDTRLFAGQVAGYLAPQPAPAVPDTPSAPPTPTTSNQE